MYYLLFIIIIITIYFIYCILNVVPFFIILNYTIKYFKHRRIQKRINILCIKNYILNINIIYYINILLILFFRIVLYTFISYNFN